MKIPLTPLRCLHRAIDLYGHKEAIICGDKRFTYAQFGERAEKFASALTMTGVRAGDRVAFLSFNNNALLEGYYGAAQAHAVVMPLNVRLTRRNWSPSSATPKPVCCSSKPILRRWWESCWPPGRDARDQSAIPSTRISSPRARPERADIFSFDENAIAELFYTSGSTGTPKGVMLSHRTLYLHALAVAGTFNHDDTAWNCTPSRCSMPTGGAGRRLPP